MLTKEQVVRSLFDRLATVYPKPALALSQAEVVAARCADGVTESTWKVSPSASSRRGSKRPFRRFRN
jgi:hypothetical protein